MRNKRKKGGLLTVAMIWAAFATTNYNPAIADNYTINNYEDLNKALSGQEFEDSGNPSTLQAGDTVIIEGNITSTSSITTAIDNITLNGGGNSYSANIPSLNGFDINSKGQTIENITISGFNNAINVTSNGSLTLTNTIFNNNAADIINSGNITLTGNNTLGTITGTGSLTNSGNLALNNNANITNISQSSGSITTSGNATISNSNISNGSINVSGNGNLDFKGGTLGRDTQLAINSGSTFTNSGNVTLNNNDTLNGSFKQSTGSLNLAGATTNGKLSLDGGEVNVTGNQTLTGDDTIGSGGDTIGSGVDLTVDATLTNDGGTINLNNNDLITSNGSISQTSGTINADNFATTNNGGSLKVNGGSLKISSGGLTLNNANDKIADGATVNMNGNLTINNGSVTLSSADTLTTGTIKQTSGNLSLAGVTTNGKLNSTGGVVNVTGNQTLKDGDTIGSGANLTVGATLTNNGGTISLDNKDSIANGGSISQTSGVINANNFSTTESGGGLQASGGSLQASGGSLNISSGGLTLNNADDNIADGATVNMDGNLTINNGLITLNTGDSLGNGTISQNGGNLTIIGISTGNSTLDANSGNLTLNGATLTGNDTIAGTVNTTIGVNGVKIQGTGEAGVTLTNEDTINGQIKQTGGVLNLNNATMDGHLYSESGNLNIENSQTLLQGDFIDTNTIVTLDGSLNVNGANVTINDNDKLNSGSMNLTNGNLNLNNITTKNVNINATGGTLQLSGVTLDNQEDNIGFGSKVTFNGDVNITKGNVEIDSNDVLTTGTITLNQAAGATATLGVDGLKTDAVNLDLQEGTLNIINNGLELNNESDVIQKEIITNVDGNLTINEGMVLLNEDDSWKSGIVSVSSNGKLQFENFEATSNSDTTLKMDGEKSLTELISSTVTFGNAENISDGTIAIDYDSGILIQSGSYNLYDMKTSGSISTINGGYENHAANKMTILNNTTQSTISGDDITGDGLAAFGIDLYARNADKIQNSDVFSGKNLTLSDANEAGEINVADYVLNGNLHRGDAPIDRYYNFKIFDYENIDPNIVFSSTDKETFTPIGYYKLTSNGDGSYTLGLARYNKQVFRLQATTLAQYNNQLAINDLVTSHHILHGERQLANANSNRFAAATPNLGPYQYGQQEGGLWFKSYADIERLSMTQDLNVHNTAYGAIIGADFPIVNLKKGWKFIPTPYIGYNGAHQSFNDVSAYQTGGQLGFMGTFMKNNYISSHTIYGGGYYNEMHVDNVLDNTGNWFWGTAHRFAYNWNIKRNFIIQPNFLASYNMFGEQNLHSDFGAMGMRSGMLNGVNIAPGLNFIYAKDDWSLYLGAQYLYNINEQVSGRAGNVYLPNLNMRHGYIQYGIGATKNIKDDLSTYAQVMIRNGGRTGIAFQLGLQYYFDIHEIGSKIKNGYNIAAEKIKNIKK